MFKKRGKLVGGGVGKVAKSRFFFFFSDWFNIGFFVPGRKSGRWPKTKKVRDRKRNNFGRKRNRNFSMQKKTETDIFYFKRIFLKVISLVQAQVF